MKVVQILSSLSPGDGVGNDCIAIKRALLERGYDTCIYAENISPKLPKGTAIKMKRLPQLEDDDIVIFHLAIGTDLNFKIDKINGIKVLRYHNITPPSFFRRYNRSAQNACSYGYEGVKYLSDKMDYGLIVSEYNRQDLIRMGYRCEMNIMPILIAFPDYEKEPDWELINKYKDGRINIVFTGRINPNKKQEDIIRTFYLYKKYYNSDARLFLVGSYQGMELYYERLQHYVDRLGVKDVYFTGHIPFSQILAYYHLADAFLCMSEHEGFCIPLVEAMYFNVPIIAYKSSAIGDTLAGTGILLKEKDYLIAAGWLNRLASDDILRENIIEKQRLRLADFQYETVKKQLYQFLDKIIKSR
ncbi:glycosyltransferase family 4 protein [Hungatella effluvii]|uniref:glycosyltransferase family 4 protein n=1 Tax=Hungatella effluvii TaxID=1096246 RepID=UPI0022DF2803|nr:glycosyltransferase family 4 protein [Hungatella effluvii]